MSAEQELGAIDYAFDVPALDPAGHRALQRALLRPLQRRPLWWRGLMLLVWAGGGPAIGLLLARQNWFAMLWFGRGDTGEMWKLDAGATLLVGLGLLLGGLFGGIATILVQQVRMVNRVHADGGPLYGAHRLLLGEHGMLWRNASRTLILPWSQVTGLVPGRDQLLVIFDRVSAVWLPESLLAGLPDRAAFMAYLQSRIPAGRATTPPA